MHVECNIHFTKDELIDDIESYGNGSSFDTLELPQSEGSVSIFFSKTGLEKFRDKLTELIAQNQMEHLKQSGQLVKGSEVTHDNS